MSARGAMWREAFDAGRAGSFKLNLADALTYLEKALDSPRNPGEPE